MMAIFWTSWLVATNMTPFAMIFHNQLQALNGCAKHRVYAQKQLQLFLGSYFCQLDIYPSLFLYFFRRLVFPCSYLIGGTIPTSLLVLLKNIFTPLVILKMYVYIMYIRTSLYNVQFSSVHILCIIVNW